MNESATDARLAGQIATTLLLEEMEEIIKQGFPGTAIRESSHYGGGRYLKVPLKDHDRITFERHDGGEYLVRGEVEEAANLLEIAEDLGSIFEEQGLPYRLEVYEGEELVGSFPLG